MLRKGIRKEKDVTNYTLLTHELQTAHDTNQSSIYQLQKNDIMLMPASNLFLLNNGNFSIKFTNSSGDLLTLRESAQVMIKSIQPKALIRCKIRAVRDTKCADIKIVLPDGSFIYATVYLKAATSNIQFFRYCDSNIISLGTDEDHIKIASIPELFFSLRNYHKRWYDYNLSATSEDVFELFVGREIFSDFTQIESADHDIISRQKIVLARRKLLDVAKNKIDHSILINPKLIVQQVVKYIVIELMQESVGAQQLSNLFDPSDFDSKEYYKKIMQVLEYLMDVDERKDTLATVYEIVFQKIFSQESTVLAQIVGQWSLDRDTITNRTYYSIFCDLFFLLRKICEDKQTTRDLIENNFKSLYPAMTGTTCSILDQYNRGADTISTFASAVSQSRDEFDRDLSTCAFVFAKLFAMLPEMKLAPKKRWNCVFCV